MSYLIIYAHPNPESFSNGTKEKIIDVLKQKNENFEVRDLYQLNFNPILSAHDFLLMQKGNYSDDVKAEQEFIKKSKKLIFIFPIWWYSFPAILKGYIDRVFSYGFAYIVLENGEIKGLLENKEVLIFANFGGSKEEYESSNFDKCLENTFAEIFRFCGIKNIKIKFFYSVPYVSDDIRKGYLKEVEDILKSF